MPEGQPQSAPSSDGTTTISIPFPMKGLDDSTAYSEQEPLTSPDLLNVWPIDSRTKRNRGGSRHGVTRHCAALDGSNPIQCLHQADASTLVGTQTGAANNQTIGSSTTQSSAVVPSPTLQPANTTAPPTNYAVTGNGSVIVPAQGQGYYLVEPNTANTSATKTALGGTNTYLGSCWRQNGQAVILSTTNPAAGSSTINMSPNGLLSGITAAATSLVVSSLASMPKVAPFIIQIESEQMKVTAVTVATNTLTISRAFNGTSAATHAERKQVSLLGNTFLTSAASATDTTLNVSDGGVFPSSGTFTIQIEAEQISVTSRSGNVLTVTRAAGVAHTINRSVQQVGQTTLNGGINSAVTSLVVSSESQFPSVAPFTLQIESEMVRVTAIAGTTFTVTRGYNGSTAASHSTGVKIDLLGATRLNAAITTTTATTVTISPAPHATNAPAFPTTAAAGTRFVILVDSEQMQVTAVSGTTFTVSRGFNGTTAATHLTGATVSLVCPGVISVTDTTNVTLTVASPSTFPTSTFLPFNVLIESEKLRVTAISGSNFTVTRGIDGTVPASHAHTTAVTQSGAASKSQVQYQVVDSHGTEVKALTNLALITNGSTCQGIVAQEDGTSDFIWIWLGGIQALTDTFTGFTISSSVNTLGREAILKYAISSAGVLTASAVIQCKDSTNTAAIKMQRGLANSAHAPRHGGLTIIPDPSESRIVVTETGDYITAGNTNFVATHVTQYGVTTTTFKEDQIVALPSNNYSGSVAAVPQQILATASRTNGAKFVLSQFVDGPGGEDSTKVTSLRANIFPGDVTVPEAVSTTVTIAGVTTTQTHNLPEEVKLVETSLGSAVNPTDNYTSIAYNGLTNRVLAVRRKRFDGSGQTAAVFSLGYTGSATGGGLVVEGSPLGGISIEWCAPAPWGWIVAGKTADGTNDLIALNHNLGTTNANGTSMWSSTIGWTDPLAIRFGASNHVRLANYTTGAATASSPVGVLYSDTALEITERTVGGASVPGSRFAVQLNSQPTGVVTITLTSSDTGVATISPGTLTFTTLNWNTPQFVAVSGVAGVGTRSATVTSTISSTVTTDPYNSIPSMPPVTISVLDADPSVLYGENRTSFTVAEGASISLPVRLGSQPAANVVLTFTSSDAAQLTVSPATLTFTSGNYATDQRITITGVSDSTEGEGDLTYTIAVTSASADAGYNGPAFNPTDLTVVVEDFRTSSGRILARLAVCGGKLFNVTSANSDSTTTFTRVGSETFSTSRIVRAANLGVRVFFADGSSQLEYDASKGVLKTWTPVAGQFPAVGGHKPQCVEAWNDSILLFGIEKDPQNWFKSRKRQPDDFNFQNTQDITGTPQDIESAQKGSFAAAGLFPGGVLNGIIPYNNDLSIWGGDSGLYQMAGDPAAGAVFDEITSSSGVGMAFGRAWCKDPLGQVYFFGRTGGVYRMRLNQPAAIQTSRITSFGVERMMDVDLDKYNVSMVWDAYMEGVHLLLTPFNAASSAYWWFFNAATEGWFPQRLEGSLTSGHSPLAVTVFDGDQSNDRFIVFGGRDGVQRKLSASATTDDGTEFNSYVVTGPLMQPPGKVLVNRVMVDQTGSATWTALAGETPAAALSAAGNSYGTLSGNVSSRKRVRGRFIYMKASRTTGAWAMDRVTADVSATRN